MKRNTKGQAMLIVIGVMALLTTLSLVVLLAASTMMGSSRRNAISTRCRMAAVSFSNMFGDALKEDEFKDGSPGKVIAQMIQEDAEGDDGSNGKFSYCRSNHRPGSISPQEKDMLLNNTCCSPFLPIINTLPA